MKKEYGYWVDDNNNRWDSRYYPEEEAAFLSTTLYDCQDCTNCKYCIYCTKCTNCVNCNACVECRNCYNCGGCCNCDYCDYCFSCSWCSSCNFCYCTYSCTECDSCKGCGDYISNPMRYTTEKIGSRSDNTFFYCGETYYDKKNVQVACGCFSGDLHEFEKAVETKHGDNEYAQQYRKEIEKVKVLFELE